MEKKKYFNELRMIRRFAGRICLPSGWMLITLLLSVLTGGVNAEPLRLQLKWLHQFQFAGYYAALEQGYYQQAGLDVEIIPAGPGMDPVQQVLDGQADFGVGTSELLLLRHQGEPVVVLAVIMQHSPLVFLTKKKDEIQTLHDLYGQRIAIEPGSAELFAYLRREDIKALSFEQVEHAYDIAPLIAGDIIAQSAYVTTEPYMMLQQGEDYQVYSPRAVGIDFYGDNLFTTEAMIRERPEKVRAFREASLRGWKYAMDNQAELVELIETRYQPRLGREGLEFEAGRMQQLLVTDLIEPGHMIADRWRGIADVYAELDMLPADFSLDGFLYDPDPPPLDLTRLYLGFLLTVLGLVVLSGFAAYIWLINRRISITEERFRTYFEYTPLASVVSDSEGRIVEWNRAASQIFGWSKSEAIGESMYGFLVPESSKDIVSDTVGTTLKEQQQTELINENVTRDHRQITCEWRNTPFRTFSGKATGVLSLGADITQRLEMETALRQARDEAKQSLEEHLQFLSMLSHELRSPLASMLSASRLLEEAIPDENQLAENALVRIRRAISRMRVFLDNLSIEDRLQQDVWQRKVQEISVNALLQPIIDWVRISFPGEHFAVNISDGENKVKLDPELVRVLLNNLLDNAFKYAPRGSLVQLSITLDDQLVIQVIDQGLGLTAEEWLLLFSKYRRGMSNGSTPGSGLGLYIVRHIAELHGGSVNVQHDAGRGNVFTVRLPPEPLSEEA